MFAHKNVLNPKLGGKRIFEIQIPGKMANGTQTASAPLSKSSLTWQ